MENQQIFLNLNELEVEQAHFFLRPLIFRSSVKNVDFLWFQTLGWLLKVSGSTAHQQTFLNLNGLEAKQAKDFILRTIKMWILFLFGLFQQQKKVWRISWSSSIITE
jgi:hypothetical protein